MDGNMGDKEAARATGRAKARGKEKSAIGATKEGTLRQMGAGPRKRELHELPGPSPSPLPASNPIGRERIPTKKRRQSASSVAVDPSSVVCGRSSAFDATRRTRIT